MNRQKINLNNKGQQVKTGSGRPAVQVVTSCGRREAVGRCGHAGTRAPDPVYGGNRAIWDSTNETPVVSAPAEGIAKERWSVDEEEVA